MLEENKVSKQKAPKVEAKKVETKVSEPGFKPDVLCKANVNFAKKYKDSYFTCKAGEIIKVPYELYEAYSIQDRNFKPVAEGSDSAMFVKYDADGV